MSQYSPEALLALASFFEKRAKSFLPINNSLTWTLYNWLPGEVADKDVEDWYQKNQSVLGNKLEKHWARGNGNFLESYQGTNSQEEQVTIRLYLISQPDISDLDVKQEAILQPSGLIPPLWMYVGAYASHTSLEQLDVDSAHNGFLGEAFASLFSHTMRNNLKQKMSEFVNANRDKINKIRSMFSYPPKKLGAGAEGVVFSIGPNLVLKIFQDTYSFRAAQKAIQRLHENSELAKTEAMIYDVGQLGDWYGYPVYYYIMELMKPVTSFNENVKFSIATIAKQIIILVREEMPTKWRRVKELISNEKYHKDIKEHVSKSAKELEINLKNIVPAYYFERIEKEIPNLRSSWLTSLIEEIIMKYLTGRTDLHTGNIGVTNYGEFRYFDPAHSDWTSEINPPYVPGS